MGISNEEFIEMSDACGVGIKLHWRMDGVEYGFATFGEKPEVLGALRRTTRSMMATLFNKGIITASQWDEFQK